jgi:hypothetical protein
MVATRGDPGGWGALAPRAASAPVASRATLRTEARFPSVPAEDGHYESFYLKASDPQGGRAIWIRHTVHKRPGAEPTCAVWVTWFDDQAGPPRAAKRQFGATELSIPEGAYVRVHESEIGPDWVRGSVGGEGTAASWGLRFTDRHETLRHLPAKWMYEARLPRTKLLSPHPGALFDGTFEIDGERIEISSWPGMVGHNWGAEHAERWVWMQATGFEGGGPSDYLDIAAGRVRLGPVTTPWIANGRLVLDGAEHRIGGVARSLRGTIRARPQGCEVRLAGDGVRLDGGTMVPAGQLVAWVYSDPGGGEHHALNCSVSDLEFTLRRRGERPRKLRMIRGAAYELGSRDTGHGVPVQPFKDG